MKIIAHLDMDAFFGRPPAVFLPVNGRHYGEVSSWRPNRKTRHPMITFAERVLLVVSKIPKGETLTYKEVARLAGRPGASRAVGNVLSKNYGPKIPCHRVIRSDGKIGGYNRGPKEKARRLRQEGWGGK